MHFTPFGQHPDNRLQAQTDLCKFIFHPRRHFRVHGTLHNLYQQYPDEKIDVPKEQQLIEAYDKIIFPVPVLLVQLSAIIKEVVR